MEKIGVYIHVPFCKKKCYYCDFDSNPQDSELEKAYIEALTEELRQKSHLLKEYKVHTIYIGGGTPSVIDLEPILKMLYPYSDDVKEWTVEVNPESLSQSQLGLYKKWGVNRLSMGLQSPNDDELQAMGRLHSFDGFLKAYEMAKGEGFDNINIDLMFGLPKQSLEQWQRHISKVIQLKPTHLSVYSLKIEENTVFDQWLKEKKISLLDEELERTMYHVLIEKLLEAGYHQYEISNFSLEGKASQHNLMYWENHSYLGLGPSAHSKYKKQRLANVSGVKNYIKKIKSNESPTIEVQNIDHNEDLFETLMLGLRLNQGVNIRHLEKKYGIDFLERYGEIVENLVKRGLLEHRGSQITLTLKGMDFSNQVFLDLMI